MNRIKDYAGFVGWFAGLGYIVLWPVTASGLSGEPFGAAIFCRDGMPSLLESLCHWVHPLQLAPGLHVFGSLSAIFVASRLLVHAVRRSRGATGLSARRAVPSTAQNSAAFVPPRRKPAPMRRPVKPRTQFGLRGMPH